MTRATRQPNNQMITALQDVTFTCKTKGFDVKYEWKHHNNSGSIGNQSSLTISRATPLDEGQYYCVAMTEGGYAFSNNVTLRVNGENTIGLFTYAHYLYRFNCYQSSSTKKCRFRQRG